MLSTRRRKKRGLKKLAREAKRTKRLEKQDVKSINANAPKKNPAPQH